MSRGASPGVPVPSLHEMPLPEAPYAANDITAPFEHDVAGHALRVLHLVCFKTIIIRSVQMRKIK